MLEQTQRPFEVPEMSRDKRVRVFRRLFATKEGVSELEAMQVDSYVVVSRHYVIVLDTLLCPEDMELIMSSLQQECEGKQIFVVDSHADWDHCWGNNYFIDEQAAPIIAHDLCFTRMHSQEAQDDLQEYQQLYPLFHNVVLTKPTITFSHEFTFHDEDLTLKFFSAPGHHLDQIAAWIPELRLLFAFDSAEWPFPSIENAQGVPLMYATLEHLALLEPQHVLCSHGKTTHANILKSNFDYIKQIEQRGRTFLTSADTDLNLKDVEHPSILINYPFEEVIADITGTQSMLDMISDAEYYRLTHENNTRAVLEWLASMT